MDVEIVVEFSFEAEHGSQLGCTRTSGCEIPNAVIRLHQVAIRRSDHRELPQSADADVERIQDRWQVGAGID